MFLVLFNPCTQCILPCKKWRHWWNNLAGEGLWRVRGAAQVPNGTVGTRAGPHKTFQRATFQIGALWSIFYPIHKIFGVWLDFVPQVKCQKGRVFFPFLRERSPLKMERKKYDICYKALDPRPKMALFFRTFVDSISFLWNWILYVWNGFYTWSHSKMRWQLWPPPFSWQIY